MLNTNSTITNGANNSNVSFSIGSNSIQKKPDQPISADTSNTNKSLKNLIDLDTNLELDANLSIFELFDPLTISSNVKSSRKNSEINNNNVTNDPSENRKLDNKKNENDPEPASNTNTNIKKETTTSSLTSQRVKPKSSSFNEKIHNKNNSTVNRYKKRIERFDLKPCSDEPIANKEFAKFIEMVNELKSKTDVEQKELSNLIVFTPVLDCPVGTTNRKREIKINVRFNPDNSSNNQV